MCPQGYNSKMSRERPCIGAEGLGWLVGELTHLPPTPSVKPRLKKKKKDWVSFVGIRAGRRLSNNNNGGGDAGREKPKRMCLFG